MINLRGKDPKIELLAGLPGFEGFRKRELARMTRWLDEAMIPAGTTFIHEGAVARQVFLIVDGEAEVSQGGAPVARLLPGQFVGEMALLDNKPRSASVRAATNLHVLVANPAGFSSLMQQPAVVRVLSESMAERLRTTDAAAAAA
jgi:CRP-like cAMP-binding protein